MTPSSPQTNIGTIVSVHGSVVDIRFTESLPSITTLLRTGEAGEIAIEMMAPIGRGILSRIFDVFGRTIDRQPQPANLAWRSVHQAPPTLSRRSIRSEIFLTGIKVIFFIFTHASWSVRHTCLSNWAAGSLTALPIIETEAQNISASIPTNLISITEGQIFLSPSLFELGVLPAVDVGQSVSRVGGKVQRAVYRRAAGDLKLIYAQFEELQTFTRLGTRMDEATCGIIEHGRRERACLQQHEFSPVSVPAQVTVLLAWISGLVLVNMIDRSAPWRITHTPSKWD